MSAITWDKPEPLVAFNMAGHGLTAYPFSDEAPTGIFGGVKPEILITKSSSGVVKVTKRAGGPIAPGRKRTTYESPDHRIVLVANDRTIYARGVILTTLPIGQFVRAMATYVAGSGDTARTWVWVLALSTDQKTLYSYTAPYNSTANSITLNLLGTYTTSSLDAGPSTRVFQRVRVNQSVTELLVTFTTTGTLGTGATVSVGLVSKDSGYLRFPNKELISPIPTYQPDVPSPTITISGSKTNTYTDTSVGNDYNIHSDTTGSASGSSSSNHTWIVDAYYVGDVLKTSTIKQTWTGTWTESSHETMERVGVDADPVNTSEWSGARSQTWLMEYDSGNGITYSHTHTLTEEADLDDGVTIGKILSGIPMGSVLYGRPEHGVFMTVEEAITVSEAGPLGGTIVTSTNTELWNRLRANATLNDIAHNAAATVPGSYTNSMGDTLGTYVLPGLTPPNNGTVSDSTPFGGYEAVEAPAEFQYGVESPGWDMREWVDHDLFNGMILVCIRKPTQVVLAPAESWKIFNGSYTTVFSEGDLDVLSGATGTNIRYTSITKY